MITKIGITERGDATLDTSWFDTLSKKNPVIAITKNVALLDDELSKRFTFYDKLPLEVHATITGYGGTVIEPNVPDYKKSCKGLIDLKIPNEAKVLRIDPVIPIDAGILMFRDVLDFFAKESVKLSSPCVPREIRVSFIDAYDHVRKRFNKIGYSQVIRWNGINAPLDIRNRYFNEMLKIKNSYDILKNIPLVTCGEPGMTTNIGCVSKSDIDYFCRILHDNVAEYSVFNNQRESCQCCSLKYELLSNKVQCAHHCLYCYWN